MSTECNYNIDDLKLRRPGITQNQRYLAALDPNNNPVDAHGIAQKIAFARELASFIQYYNTANAVDGDWSPFFTRDVAVPLAIAAIQDLDYYKNHVQQIFVKLNTNNLPDTTYTNAIGELFSILGSLAIQLDALLQNLSDELELKPTLRNLIRTKLAGAFQRLIAQYNLGVGNLVVDVVVPRLEILHQSAISMQDAMGVTLSPDWTSPNSSLNLFGTGTVFQQLNFLANHQLFKSIFDDFLGVYARVVTIAQKDLEKTLEAWDKHTPHYALFLSFIKLLEYARSLTNTLTARHLDFYYRDILQLKEKAAQPSSVHVMGELAKHATTFLVKHGELFNAGKDELKNDVFFASQFDTVLNKARVSELKTIYRHSPESNLLDGGVIHDGRVFASSKADSDDGIQEELTSKDKSWHPFFNKKYRFEKLKDIQMPMANIGFGISSHYLFLAEGKRTISLTLNLTELDPTTDIPLDAFTFYLTTEKDWLIKRQYGIRRIDPGSASYTFTIELDGNDPPITSYAVKAHGFQLNTDLPVLFVKLRQENTNAYFYNTLANAVIHSINLQVEVEKLKTLAISNDFGPVDASKPFQPFGAAPVKNQSLVIGSKEVFQKKLDYLKLNFNWLKRTRPYGEETDSDLFFIPYLFPFVETKIMELRVFDALSVIEDLGRIIHVRSAFLKNGDWHGHGDGYSLYSNNYEIQNGLGPFSQDNPDNSDNEFYATSSRSGFMKLSLQSGFGHNQYLNDLTLFLQDNTKTNPGSVPIGPTMDTLSIDYGCSQLINLTPSAANVSNASFFHFAPFGQPEQKTSDPHLTKIYLLPQFKITTDNILHESEAEFYIGIDDLKPPQTLSLLFQVVDGTAHPLVEKPNPHIQWSYLAHNHWINFRDNEMEDRTAELLQSGIIAFSVPREASSNNSLLPNGKHWIRAAVQNKSNAICRLIGVKAQAMLATFEDNHNDPDFSATTLPTESISKLKFPSADVKSIEQPYPSFGGKAREVSAAFYTRVSERLRHKDRAVALWDYEHLILEQFPAIHRVKCLNHTAYEPSPEGVLLYKELAPGHVTIITIPAYIARNAPLPLKPFTSLSLLKEVETFIKNRVSCFVNLHVRNPLFEEVRVVANVRFRESVDEMFFQRKLQEAITRYLSPWAFADGETPTFGGKIYKSNLINFVEEQPYVDYVSDFQVYVDIHEVPGTVDLNVVEGSTAVSALVSVPSEKHQLTIISPVEAEGLHEKCICAS